MGSLVKMKSRAGDVLIQRCNIGTSSVSIGRSLTFEPTSQVGAASRGEPFRMTAMWIGAVIAAFILALDPPATAPTSAASPQSTNTPSSGPAASPTPLESAAPAHGVSLLALLSRNEHAIGLVPDAATWSGEIVQGGTKVQYASMGDIDGRFRTVYTMPYGQRSEGSDGSVHWVQDVNGDTATEQLARRRSLTSRLIGFNAALRDPSIVWTLDGESTLDGKQVYRLHTKFGEFNALFYVDARSSLLDGVDIASRSIRYTAYNRFGPLTMPSTTVETQDDVNVTTTVTGVNFSERVEASFTPPPSRLPEFPAGQAEVGLNIDEPRSLIVVTASINSRPIRMLVDSGSSTSLIDLDAAKAMGLPTSGSAHVAGAAMLTGAVARAETLDLNGLRFHPFIFEAVPLGLPSTLRGYGIQGILGYDVLARVVARIDYGRAHLRLISPSSFSYNGTGAVIPLDAGSRVPRVAATLSGKDPVTFTVDTGSDSGLILYSDFAQSHARDFMKPGDLASEACNVPPCDVDLSKFFGDLRIASGAGGNIHVKTAYVQRLDLGKFAVERAFNEIVLQPTGAFVPSQSDGLLGAGVLTQFGAVFLDYGGGRLILER
jgi:predicted aspartyl protease